MFDGLDVMARFRERFEARYFRPVDAPSSTRCSRAIASGAGRRSPPTDPDHRLPRGADLERVRDPADRFEARGVPTVVADPRDLAFDGTTLVAEGRAIDLVYRRVLVNDVIARADDCARPGARLSPAGASAWPTRCAARSRTRRRSSRVLTDDAVTARAALSADGAERAVVGRAIPWTRVVEDARTTVATAGPSTCSPTSARSRDRLCSSPTTSTAAPA